MAERDPVHPAGRPLLMMRPRGALPAGWMEEAGASAGEWVGDVEGWVGG